MRCFLIFFGKNPHAHKNRIGTSTPPSKKAKNPPKGGILWAWGFSSRKNQKMPGAHKIGAAISGPRIAGANFMDITLFLIHPKIQIISDIISPHHPPPQKMNLLKGVCLSVFVENHRERAPNLVTQIAATSKSQIASDCNRNSKNHCDSENTL